MKEHQYQYEDLGDASHDYSRSQIKQQIAQLPHESFDVSSFNESRAPIQLPSRYLRSNFPVSHAPTLQTSPNQCLNKLEELLDEGTEGPQELTTRNKVSQVQRKKLKIEEKIYDLEKQLQAKSEQECILVQNINDLNKKNFDLEKRNHQKDLIIRAKDQQIMKEKKILKQLNEKLTRTISQQKNTHSHCQSGSQSCYMEEFCPEFLSPDESLQLLDQLLAKIDKSSRLRKKVGKNKKLCDRMAHILESS